MNFVALSWRLSIFVTPHIVLGARSGLSGSVYSPCIIYETSLANGARPYSYLMDTLDIYINEYQFILLMAVIA